MSESPREAKRRRWINFGEVVAVGALAISALGLWNSWQGGKAATEVVEKKVAVPLTLRGIPKKDGRALTLEPVEPGHALDGAIVIFGKSRFELAGEAQLDADDIERAIDQAGAAKGEKSGDGLHRLPLRIDARYVEAGQTRRSVASYSLTYRWQDGGLFGGRSLRLAGLSLVSR